MRGETFLNKMRFSCLIVLNELLQRSLMGNPISVTRELAQRQQSLRDGQRSGK